MKSNHIQQWGVCLKGWSSQTSWLQRRSWRRHWRADVGTAQPFLQNVCPASPPLGAKMSVGWASFWVSAQCCKNWARADSDQSTREEGEEVVRDAGSHVTVWAEWGGKDVGLLWRGWNKGNMPSAAAGKWTLGWGCKRDQGPWAEAGGQQIQSMP